LTTNFVPKIKMPIKSIMKRDNMRETEKTSKILIKRLKNFSEKSQILWSTNKMTIDFFKKKYFIQIQ
jgi:hypothetical protein